MDNTRLNCAALAIRAFFSMNIPEKFWKLGKIVLSASSPNHTYRVRVHRLEVLGTASPQQQALSVEGQLHASEIYWNFQIPLQLLCGKDMPCNAARNGSSGVDAITAPSTRRVLSGPEGCTLCIVGSHPLPRRAHELPAAVPRPSTQGTLPGGRPWPRGWQHVASLEPG